MIFIAKFRLRGAHAYIYINEVLASVINNQYYYYTIVKCTIVHIKDSRAK